MPRVIKALEDRIKLVTFSTKDKFTLSLKKSLSIILPQDFLFSLLFEYNCKTGQKSLS